MERSHQLEQEVKLEVGPEWELPDLAGVFPGAEVRPLAPVHLETTYYDTPSRRLARRQITLRRREQRPARPATGPDAGGPESLVGRDGGSADGPGASSEWTVKLPPAAERGPAAEAPAVTKGSLARTEVNWPETAAADAPARGTVTAPAGGTAVAGVPGARESAVHPPSEVSRLLAGVTFGEPLVPIARLSSTRRRTRILANGHPVAEVDDDSVRGTALAMGGAPGPAADQAPGPSTVVSFREVEVELVEGSPPELLDVVVARLVNAGARPSPRRSKLVAVLQSAAHPPPAEEEVSALQAEVPTSKPRKNATMGSVLRDQARSCLDVLVEHDPPVRLGDPDPEHVHKARVATRRLRSFLWALRRLHHEDEEEGVVAMNWLAALRQELRWLSGALGEARDADVRVLRLETECAKLPPADRSAAAVIIDAARSEQSVAHQKLLEVMDSERYLGALHCLEALARRAEAPPGAGPVALSAPPAELWHYLEVPAPAAMATLGAAQWRSARRAVRRLGEAPPDEALHRVRIEAKRLRYIAEAAAQVARPAASRRAAQAMAVAATELQDVLGELHDAVVGEQWLRDLAARPLSWPEHQPEGPGQGVSTAGNDVALVAGELVAATRSTAAACRAAWKQKWRRLERKGLTKWLSA